MVQASHSKTSEWHRALSPVVLVAAFLQTDLINMLSPRRRRHRAARCAGWGGCRRLEVGLQSTYEDVARDTNRGHSVASVGDCFRMAKNAGFKVGRGALQQLPFPHFHPPTRPSSPPCARVAHAPCGLWLVHRDATVAARRSSPAFQAACPRLTPLFWPPPGED